MPDPDDLCKCGHEYKIHIKRLFGVECTGLFWVYGKKKCKCEGFVPMKAKQAA